MDENEIVSLALLGLKASAQLVAMLQKQHGLTDAQLLDLAGQADEDTRNAALKFVASL